jgi:Domain of unknown function (DU1801)
MSVDPAVEQYIESLPEDRREAVRSVHERVHTEVPELGVKMWNRFIGYGTYRYRLANGKEHEWFVIGLTNQKRYVSLYICAAEDGGYLAEQNAERLGKVSVGKSCVRFTKLENLELDVAAELCRRAVKLVDEGSFGI